MPTSTMVDAKGNTIAWLASCAGSRCPRTRSPTASSRLIKRFADHSGVEGHLTGLAGYASGDLDTRGGSTLEQQYVKELPTAGDSPNRCREASGRQPLRPASFARSNGTHVRPSQNLKS